MSARIDLAAYPDTTRTDLAIIKELLALQIRLLAITSGLERDGQAVAHAKQDVAAVCRGDFNEVGSRRELEALNSIDDGAQGLGGDGVAEPPVGDSGHDASPSFDGVDSLSAGEHPAPRSGNDRPGAGFPGGQAGA